MKNFDFDSLSYETKVFALTCAKLAGKSCYPRLFTHGDHFLIIRFECDDFNFNPLDFYDLPLLLHSVCFSDQEIWFKIVES